ncbi:hypothetical protein LCGC14_1959980 [marine sediment metagenome]|uniref:Histidine kinase/HSP90-like ATPase domain-containing protein n=1 Tax=marine sediment metagenome TaxID=412755 RepID=A0A0F9IBZ9_9ZZZZ
MDKVKQIKYEPLEASPVKSFFVRMLTRDIELGEAILDLLDNCVDGILRTKKKNEGNKPYEGFRAEIEFNKDTFTISDNCGGIPWKLHDYAFRMGRATNHPPDVPGTVGVYGIGMKRAIFKIGRHCLISTRNGDHRYEVEITPKWLDDESDWKIPVANAKRPMDEEGTTIVVGELNPGITERFNEGAKSFQQSLDRMVSTHYSYIIDKGFEVKINGQPIKPRTTKLIFNDTQEKASIRPFIFKTKKDGVDVFLSVGFTRGIPTPNDIADEQEQKKYSSEDAGWTIICNDRVVLYCDRSEMTGWGEAGVPRYHTQFIAISGIVEFKSDDASKLPTTTTKRGVDASSPLYLQTKNKMREGMRFFTDYTNQWKGRAEEAQKHFKEGKPLSFNEIKTETQRLHLNPTTRSFPPGEQYKPDLPLPKRLEPTRRRISFIKHVADIKAVAEYFGDIDMEPSEAGEKCFDLFLREARK